MINEGESSIKIDSESAVKQQLVRKTLNKSARPMTATQSNAVIRKGMLRSSMGARLFKRAANQLIDRDEPTIIDIKPDPVKSRERSPKKDPLPPPEVDRTAPALAQSGSTRVLQDIRDLRTKPVSSMSTYCANENQRCV